MILKVDGLFVEADAIGENILEKGVGLPAPTRLTAFTCAEVSRGPQGPQDRIGRPGDPTERSNFDLLLV